MDKSTALEKLQALKGQDLRRLADEVGVAVWKDGKKDKGWAGHTIERYLGLAQNSSRSPNLGSWELKVVSLRERPNGACVVKETMAITMIDPYEVAGHSFEESHLFTKLRKVIAIARVWEDKMEPRSLCKFVHAFDLAETDLYQGVARDYEDIRRVITMNGFDALSGIMGAYVQPRTKGPGHGSKSRAFYARKQLVEYIIGMRPSPRAIVEPFTVEDAPAPIHRVAAESRAPYVTS